MNRHASHFEVAPGVFRERMGLCFEDIEIGETYEHRPGKTFTIEESMTQTLRALDQTPEFTDLNFHEHITDGVWAVNPLHVLASLTGMMTKTFSRVVANLAWTQVKFHEPVRDGDTVYAETTVLGKRESQSRAGQGIVQLRTTARTHHGRLVCIFGRNVLVYARGQGPYEDAGY